MTIEVHSGPLGTFLTDAAGKSLYMFASDTQHEVHLHRPVPDLLAAAGRRCQGGFRSDGQQARHDQVAGGAKQVTYAGHPLYYYAGDSKAGDTSGPGLDQLRCEVVAARAERQAHHGHVRRHVPVAAAAGTASSNQYVPVTRWSPMTAGSASPTPFARRDRLSTSRL